MKTIVGVLFFILSLMPFQEARCMENKQLAADKSWMKTKGNFEVTLFFTDKPNELVDKWNQSTEGVDIGMMEEIKRDIPITAFIMFSNCASDDKGIANVTVKFTVYAPEGNIYTKTEEIEVLTDKFAPPENTPELSVNFLQLKFKNKSTAGIYTVKALVNDKKAGVKIELERKLRVIE